MFKSFFSFFKGNLVAQLVTFAMLPIISRIYTPDEYGMYSTYMSTLSIITIFITAKYELAIVLHKLNSVALAVFNATQNLVKYLTITIIFIYITLCVMLPKTVDFDWIFVLASISAAIGGGNRAYVYYANRYSNYNSLGISKLIQATVQSLASVVLAFVGGLGLIISNLLALTCVFIYFEKKFKLRNKKSDKKKVGFALKKFIEFPKYSLLGSLVDTCAVNFPIIIFGYLYTAEELGNFTFSLKVLGMPLVLVSAILTQVFYKEFVNKFNAQQSVRVDIIKYAFFLFIVFSPVYFLFYFYANTIFSFFFGSHWDLASDLSKYVGIMIWARFVVSPISVALNLDNNIKYGMYWQIIYFTFTCAAIYFSKDLDIRKMLENLMYIEVLMYLIYYLLIIRVSK